MRSRPGAPGGVFGETGGGDFQMLVSPKDKSPYYFNLSGHISIIAMGVFFLASRSRLVNRLSFVLRASLILGGALVGKIYNGRRLRVHRVLESAPLPTSK